MVERTTERLGVVLSTVTDTSMHELTELGQLAEREGFAAVLVNEGRGDALAASQAIAAATTHITVGTNIANIYFRHPFLCAATARSIAELSRGRLLLGLGMSHRGMLASLGIDMGDARQALKTYVEFVKNALNGTVTKNFLNPPPSPFPVPVYVAGNTVESATVAGAVGDGLMPFLSPLGYLPSLIAAAHTAAASAGRNVAEFGCCLSIPTFVCDDESAALSAARYNLAFFAQLPNYRRQWRRAGFAPAMDAIQEILKSGQRRDAARLIPDELVEAVCVFGRPARCRAQIAAFRKVGVELPVIAVSPVNEDRISATRRALSALAPGKKD
jgi:alkanesulfonate monooxygenase SsuD/methylene tetrahydromethanopterin reductase-like flavin-dependent oxidoreductase (luciferase family)